MDFLKAQIASSKRKAPEDGASEASTSSASPANKYIRRGELERQRELEEKRQRDARAKEKERLQQLKEEERRRKDRSKVSRGANKALPLPAKPTYSPLPSPLATR